MPAPAEPPFDAAAFGHALLAWYDVHRRRLPWREKPSLYATVVSEFMLQQTQIATALPYFERWMTQFPDFASLAQATEAEVVKAWEGLGYYTRARNLRRLAVAIVERGAPPNTRDGWLELPGIGPYTAAAVTSIALGQAVACVDGNVVRILTRLVGDDTPYPDSSRAARELTPLANSLIPRSRPGDHNQAMMELGATVCHRQSPLCTVCPVLSFCASGRTGRAEERPRLAAKKIEKKRVNRAFCVDGDRLLLHETPGGARRLAHMHELPELDPLGLDSAQENFALIATKRRAITRWQIEESIWSVPARSVAAEGLSAEYKWVPLAEIDSVTLSGPHRRWVSELLADRRRSPSS